MQPQKRKLVPIAPLEHDFVIEDMEAPASAHPKRITPFKYGPLAILKNVLWDANHFGQCKGSREHDPNRVPSANRRLRHLIVGRVLAVEVGQCFDIMVVEGFDPSLD